MSLAIITGASSGIGAEFAKQLKGIGVDEFWFVARREETVVEAIFKKRAAVIPIPVVNKHIYPMVSRCIYLHTHKNLDGALEFWTKMGFVVVLDAGDELETVHMDKQIRELEMNPLAQDFKYAVKL